SFASSRTSTTGGSTTVSTHTSKRGRSTTTWRNSCAVTSRTSTRTRTATTVPTTSRGEPSVDGQRAGGPNGLLVSSGRAPLNVYGEIIRLLVATACALFVLSLPLSKTETGATLRRWAGVCFILAFLPSLVGGVFYPART